MSATTKQTAKIHYDEIDPNDLVIGENVRDNADQGPEFEQLVSSIKETGHIYQPINVVIGADGAYVVTDGQRRTLAARRLGLATVPVRVQQPIAATDKQRTAERVTEQLATDNAKGLTVAQKAKGAGTPTCRCHPGQGRQGDRIRQGVRKCGNQSRQVH